jgi:hypothetical protein
MDEARSRADITADRHEALSEVELYRVTAIRFEQDLETR